MVCPKEDKLFQYVDGFLDNEEKEQLEQHIQACSNCKEQVEKLIKENELLEETLKAPALPDDFAENIVAQLKPYKPQQKRRRPMKWVLGTAASLLLASGVVMTVNPSFAKIVGGIFSSETVDKGLQMAIDTDIATPVNLSVTDAGITLHIEDLIADTTRIALSYRVTNENGKTLNPFIDLDHKSIKLLDEQNNEIQLGSMSWGTYDDEYGIIELSLSDIDEFEKGKVQLDLQELADKKGHWFIEIPVDLTSAYKNQKVVTFEDSVEFENVKIQLNKVKFATSTTDIDYTVGLTEEGKNQLRQQMKEKEQQFSKDIVHLFFPYQPRIGYRIENGKGEVVGFQNTYGDENRGHPTFLNMISGSGKWDGEIEDLGPINSIDSFIPEKEEEELYFVVDTIFKPTTSDFSVTFKPSELPKTFEYKGYELTIESVQEKSDYSLEKSLTPVKREKSVEIKMSGYAVQKAPFIDLWAISDENGKHYSLFNGGTTEDIQDEKGRFKRTFELVSNELNKVPEEITLHIVAETEVIPLEKEWRVPLNKN